jgi:Zn finger protein HypA/HybF involved in hydrogenase expression
MGTQVTATCQCGVDTIIMIGGGMRNFMTTCYFPCLCEHCRTVVQVNLLAKQKRCPQCKTTNVIPYDDPTLSESAGGRTVASWNIQEQLGRKLNLTDGNYRCPQCDQMTLRFTDSGLCWD